MSTAARAFMVCCAAITVAQWLVLATWGVLSASSLRRRRPATRPCAQRAAARPDAPGVTVVMPAFNEAASIVATVRSALAQDYPTIEVIVVNDGSTDDTLAVLDAAFDLACIAEHPEVGPIPTSQVRAVHRSRTVANLTVVDKAPSGAKADGSNAGVNLAAHPWVAIMDADELLEPDTIRRCMAEADTAGGATVAIGSTLLPSNDCIVHDGAVVATRVPRNYWVGCQLVEYLIAFLVARPGMARAGALPIVSGGFGLYTRDALVAAGGYRPGHLGEDLDMCVRVRRWHADRGLPGAVRQAPEAVVWTEFPATARVLGRQRVRWHRGLRTIVRDHAGVVVRRRYGTFGRFGMGPLVVFEWVGPMLEAAGYVLTGLLAGRGQVSITGALAVLVACQTVAVVTGLLAAGLAVRRFRFFDHRRDLAWLLVWCVAMPFGYRQLTLWWRIRSLLPGRGGWGEMPRAGVAVRAPA